MLETVTTRTLLLYVFSALSIYLLSVSYGIISNWNENVRFVFSSDAAKRKHLDNGKLEQSDKDKTHKPLGKISHYCL